MRNDLNGMTLPTCDILVNGQKRKLYGKKKNKVYLHNGDNFQLLVFNPLRERIGVQLKMNGIKVDNDLLIVSPGQELVIERYIGTNRKLTFSAYEIDTSRMSEERVKEVTKAIEKNGVLEVVFWNEKKPVPITYTTSTTYVNVPPITIPPVIIPTTPYPHPTIPTIPYPDPYYNVCSTTSGSSINMNENFSPLTITSTGDIIVNGNLKLNGSLDMNNGQVVVKSHGTTGHSGSSGTSGTSGISGTSGTSGSPGKRGLAHFTNISEYKRPGIFAESVDYSYSCANLNGMGRITSEQATAKWAPIIEEKKIETGRIEKGGVSNQVFSHVEFEIGEPFYSIKFKLLPFSLKPVKKKLYDSTTIKNVIEGNTYVKTESSIREYCRCGYRISRGKGVWDFCPRCGRKIKK